MHSEEGEKMTDFIIADRTGNVSRLSREEFKKLGLTAESSKLIAENVVVLESKKDLNALLKIMDGN